ncbi:hypothetical protein [Weissella paramesenteroides]|uniref:hypothetical protein n=1 Tax=Weissella paramesenteroides TaxID=1249 RepID=UPI0039826EA3
MFKNLDKVTKKKWLWVGSIIGLLLVFMIAVAIDGHSATSDSSDTKTTTKVHHKKHKAKAKSSESSSSEESVISESSSSIDTAESLSNLKSIISMPMAKENYQNLEDGVLEAAKVDEISGGATSADLSRFHSRVSNIRDIADEAKTLDIDNEDDLSSDDQTKLQDYQKLLISYLNALGDYAVIYQTDIPDINAPDTDAETVSEYQQELQEAQDKFTNAKNEWSASYDSIMNS